MTPAEAALVLSLSFAADEASTAALLRAGGRETMVQRPALRISLKVATVPAYLHLQKKSKVVRYGFPALFLAAGFWNVHQARVQNGRNR